MYADSYKKYYNLILTNFWLNYQKQVLKISIKIIIQYVIYYRLLNKNVNKPIIKIRNLPINLKSILIIM